MRLTSGVTKPYWLAYQEPVAYIAIERLAGIELEQMAELRRTRALMLTNGQALPMRLI